MRNVSRTDGHKGCTLCSASLLMMRFVNAPQFMVQGFVVLAALWAPFSQADTGWQPIQETIRKSEKDTRQYQAIRLDNDMVVLLVSDPQAVKSLSALVVPVGSCRIRQIIRGWRIFWNI